MKPSHDSVAEPVWWFTKYSSGIVILSSGRPGQDGHKLPDGEEGKVSVHIDDDP